MERFTFELEEAARSLAPVAIEHPHALGVAALPPIHRDPFDRLLVVRADLLGLVLVTADDAFDAYDVEVLRVG